MPENFSIGELGRRARCKVVTIRYYEQIGMIAKPSRSEGGHRVYQAHHLERLTFIRKARELGFSLEAVRSLLKLSDRPDTSPCADVDRLAVAHLEDVRAKIDDLRQLEIRLEQVLAGCSHTTVEDCQVLDALR